MALFCDLVAAQGELSSALPIAHRARVSSFNAPLRPTHTDGAFSRVKTPAPCPGDDRCDLGWRRPRRVAAGGSARRQDGRTPGVLQPRIAGAVLPAGLSRPIRLREAWAGRYPIRGAGTTQATPTPGDSHYSCRVPPGASQTPTRGPQQQGARPDTRLSSQKELLPGQSNPGHRARHSETRWPRSPGQGLIDVS